MDELIKAKAAREKATNAPPAQPVVAGPKTKRDQLNDLLRQYIEGKITESEMVRLFQQGETKDPAFALEKGIIHDIRDLAIRTGAQIVTANFQ